MGNTNLARHAIVSLKLACCLWLANQKKLENLSHKVNKKVVFFNAVVTIFSVLLHIILVVSKRIV